MWFVEFRGHGAVVSGHHGGDDREAEPRTWAVRAGRRRPVEAVENVGQPVRGYAWPVVADLDADRVAFPGAGNSRRRAARRVGADVREQVVDRPTEQFVVAGRDQPGCDVGQPGPLVGGHGGSLRAPGDEGADIDGLAVLARVL